MLRSLKKFIDVMQYGNIEIIRRQCGNNNTNDEITKYYNVLF